MLDSLINSFLYGQGQCIGCGQHSIAFIDKDNLTLHKTPAGRDCFCKDAVQPKGFLSWKGEQRMSDTPARRRRKGREAFAPGCDPMVCMPYIAKRPLWQYQMYVRDWLEGWKDAEEQYIKYVRDWLEGEESMSEKTNRAAMHEPPPTEGDETVLPHVIQDLKDRATVGEEKYGTKLKTMNGRDALMDAYQEALDLAMYLCQAIIERERGEISNGR